MVLVNASIEHLGFPGVSCDDAVAVEQAWRHLASLGHERIGLVLGPGDHLPSRRKLAAADEDADIDRLRRRRPPGRSTASSARG
ncbi:hypothetical protein SFUMM280S_01631 [Streptomyces fumanus]